MVDLELGAILRTTISTARPAEIDSPENGFVFFFQAEDGIRDWSVTGVQTCALPISNRIERPQYGAVQYDWRCVEPWGLRPPPRPPGNPFFPRMGQIIRPHGNDGGWRSGRDNRFQAGTNFPGQPDQRRLPRRDADFWRGNSARKNKPLPVC